MFNNIDFEQVKIVAWDFDGVLNRNIIDGRFIWADNFESDLGHSKSDFEARIFGKNIHAIITGQEDLRDHVANWAKAVKYAPGPDALLKYWFEKDALPDPLTSAALEYLTKKGLRQIITTNNERHRAAYIENEMGYSEKVEHVFASGRMGVAKPDDDYFTFVSSSLSVDPSDFLLIDDCAKNVLAAIESGWQAVHFTSEVRAALGESIII